MRKYTAYEIMHNGFSIRPDCNRDEYMRTEFVTVKSVIEKLDEIAHRLHHDTSVTCWEELASEFREELTKK